MSRKNYKPTRIETIEAHPDGDRWTLVFVRDLSHPPERVWKALTDPSDLREWAPFDPDRDLGTPGTATLTLAGGDGSETYSASVRRAEAPVLLEYVWDKDLLRWELEPTATGTRLTLRHTVQDKPWIPKVAAGWHMCLDLADRFMAGVPAGRIVAEEAMEYGWQELHDAYSDQVG